MHQIHSAEHCCAAENVKDGDPLGLERTTASNSALFIAVSPLFAAVLQTLGKGELKG